MDATKQRIRAVAARKKEEAKLVKGTEEGTSSVRSQKENLTRMMTVRQKGPSSLLVMPL